MLFASILWLRYRQGGDRSRCAAKCRKLQFRLLKAMKSYMGYAFRMWKGILRERIIFMTMHCRRPRLTALFLLLICLVCPLVESLDMWHGTFDDGNDTEFALVIAALCLGLGYIAARLLFKSEFASSILGSTFAHRSHPFFAFVLGFHPLSFEATSPPLLPLRI